MTNIIEAYGRVFINSGHLELSINKCADEIDTLGGFSFINETISKNDFLEMALSRKIKILQKIYKKLIKNTKFAQEHKNKSDEFEQLLATALDTTSKSNDFTRNDLAHSALVADGKQTFLLDKQGSRKEITYGHVEELARQIEELFPVHTELRFLIDKYQKC